METNERLISFERLRQSARLTFIKAPKLPSKDLSLVFSASFIFFHACTQMYARLFFLVADLSTTLLFKERAHGLEPSAGRTGHTMERLAEAITKGRILRETGSSGNVQISR
jgi:hypothetical protein